MRMFRWCALAALAAISTLTGCQSGSGTPAAAAATPPGPDAQPRAAGPVRTEPGAYPTMKREVEIVDAVTGSRRHVLDGVELRAGRTATLQMMLSTVVPHTFIPARIADALDAEDLGEVDLSRREVRNEGDVDEPAHLGAIYGVNRTGQTRYRRIRIARVNLGVGPAFGPVEALVLDDANASIGVVGRDWLALREGDKGFILAATGEVYFAPLRLGGE
ncbi:MAG: hypothetical protein AMXMBFR47_33120 [Planctomycetota bacterium]